MIKFFRRIRQNLLTQNKLSKYILYAIGEIFLVVIGILIALQINNWNETRKESLLEDQLIDVLITDLQLKKEECISDLDYGNRILQKSNAIIQHWDTTSTIDTLHLKSILGTLAEDDWFYNENSPIYSTLAGSGLWKQLPDSLTRQIDQVYRVDFGRIKSLFTKQTEYATQGKLNFLAPNHLLQLDKSPAEIQQIVSQNDDTFIVFLDLFRSGVVRLTTKFKETIPAIDTLMDQLKVYKAQKQS
ncbi:hypothetical protein NA63_2705 [Flavobacteriaceae bacterium MAR_2010_105]|nr:hypothetical protein NA63_2705 [Flavobacteriaceae bacterium MAR_2010_105]